MKRLALCVGLALVVAGCGNPLDRMPRLSEMALSKDAPKVDALADPDAPGIVAQVRAGQQAADDTPAPDSAGATPRKRGLLGFLRRAPKGDSDASQAPAVTTPNGPTTPPPSSGSAIATGPAVVPAPDASAPPRRAGLLGLFSRKKVTEPAPDDRLASAEVDEPSAQAPADTPTAKPRRAGLLGLFGGGGSAGSASVVDELAGTTGPLAFGVLRRVCNLSGSDRGKQVARHPGRGGRYRIYDSQPGKSSAHAFYITGFSDNCAREVTAAFAVFGGAALHETLRYSTSSKRRSWGDVDNAYERIKGQVCGARRGKPCGKQLNQLERSTVFLTVYESFSDRSRWTNLLLHNGRIVASELKAP